MTGNGESKERVVLDDGPIRFYPTGGILIDETPGGSVTDSRDELTIDGEPLPPAQPVVLSGIAPIKASWDPGPGRPLEPQDFTIRVRTPDGVTRVYRPEDEHVQALLAWYRLPWWRRWFTRKPSQ